MGVPTTETLLPEHGRIKCTACFPGGAEWGVTSQAVGGWVLENNPMAWGSRTPEILVLGVSKGARQCDALAQIPHDMVAFAGFRVALTDALRTLGLVDEGQRIDDHICSDETRWAFGSMIRCSVGLEEPSDKVRKSGTIVNLLSKDGTPAAAWMRTCIDRHLRRLPESLRLVVMLSNGDHYMQAVFERLREVHPALRRVNDVAWSDGRVTWVHIQHVGGPGKNHTSNWLHGSTGKQASKRDLAISAVAEALGRPAPALAPRSWSPTAPATRSNKKRSISQMPAPLERKTTLEDMVNNILQADHRLVRHPASKGTDKVRLYRTANGSALAHEHRLVGSQPIAVAVADIDLCQLADIPRDPDPLPATGRNHHFDTAPELKGRSLWKFRPVTAEQVRRILDAVCL